MIEASPPPWIDVCVYLSFDYKAEGAEEFLWLEC
jgi:hypothetical protein